MTKNLSIAKVTQVARSDLELKEWEDAQIVHAPP